ncbi:MAG: SgcJ/EcaC family oxidoreductase [Verrucomicrobia bacterium]|nr:SgcJ/EcaC family oxidoreductase [Verrucomicrobiota bacterium]
MNNDEQAIRTAHAVWIAAVNRGDLKLLFTMITDDVVLLNPGQERLDRAGFAAKFAGACEQLQFRCVSEIEEVVVSGGMAYTRCWDTLTATPRVGGATMQLAGNRLTVYRKQDDGRWLLARDAHTLTPVAE